MNGSPLLRAGLAVAFVAAFSLRAASQAGAPAPQAPGDAWKAAIKLAVDKGASEGVPNSSLVTRSLEVQIGDLKAAHSMHSLMVIGQPAEGGHFKIKAVQFVVAESKDPDGARPSRIDYWIFEATESGRVTKASHDTHISTAAADLPPQTAALDMADPKTKARFAAMVKFWAKRKP